MSKYNTSGMHNLWGSCCSILDERGRNLLKLINLNIVIQKWPGTKDYSYFSELRTIVLCDISYIISDINLHEPSLLPLCYLLQGYATCKQLSMQVIYEKLIERKIKRTSPFLITIIPPTEIPSKKIIFHEFLSPGFNAGLLQVDEYPIYYY